jgi:sugar (pentulose or hexulose) kinase
MANFFVGCDIGTSGTKSCVMAEDGQVLGTKYIEYPPTRVPQLGGA